MNPEIVQLIPAAGWRACITSPSVSFKDIVCFALMSDNRVVPLVVDEDDKIVELKSREDGFSIISPAEWEQLDRVSALKNREYGRFGNFGRFR